MLPDKTNNWKSRLKQNVCIAGSIQVPCLLLDYAGELKLSAGEFIALIYLMKLESQGNRAGKSAATPAEYISLRTGLSSSTTKRTLASLSGKGLYSLNHQQVDLSPLYDKLLDLWSRDFVSENTARKETAAGEDVQSDKQAEGNEELLRHFLREFPRGLSPYEYEYIIKWKEEDGFPDEVILEALKEAVLRKAKTFKYIDSILFNWLENDLMTLEEVQRHQREFKRKKATRKQDTEGVKRKRGKTKKYEELYE